MVCDLPWCSLLGRKVKREQTLCIRLNRVIVGKLESNITEAEVRVRRLRLFRSSVSVLPLARGGGGELPYITYTGMCRPTGEFF